MFSAPKFISAVSRAAAAVEITAVAYHPRGGRIACGCSHGMIRVYSTMSGDYCLIGILEFIQIVVRMEIQPLHVLKNRG